MLWLVAGLSAIAFSLANTVRGEIDRTATDTDGLRSYYLASGAIERAMLHMEWGAPFYTPGIPAMPFSFPAGEAVVEIIPETSKLSVNYSKPEDLFRLLMNLRVPPEKAQQIVEAIVDWRTLTPPDQPTGLDRYYLSLNPSFMARHASLEEIEELLLVAGMTPDIFYGGYDYGPQGELVPRAGLRDCVSVYGSTDYLDANTAQPAVLATLDFSPEFVAALVARRRASPFRDQGELNAFTSAGGPGAGRLRVGGNTIFTLRATARLRLPDGRFSDMRRSVAAMVKFMPAGNDAAMHVLRWYDN